MRVSLLLAEKEKLSMRTLHGRQASGFRGTDLGPTLTTEENPWRSFSQVCCSSLSSPSPVRPLHRPVAAPPERQTLVRKVEKRSKRIRTKTRTRIRTKTKIRERRERRATRAGRRARREAAALPLRPRSKSVRRSFKTRTRAVSARSRGAEAARNFF